MSVTFEHVAGMGLYTLHNEVMTLKYCGDKRSFCAAINK